METGMLIGIYLRLFGRPHAGQVSPSWASIRDAAVAAEAADFDRVVLEDALLYVGDDGNDGLWDPISVAAAIATTTSRIGIGHAVLNSPYHHPAIVARAAASLDEISSGRYSLGIGLGNTPDDYPRFGIAADHRYSRFEESIRVIKDLLRTGHARFDGEYIRVPEGELVLRGPRPNGPPIIIGAGKPKMLRLAALHADEWNWWTGDPDKVGAMRDLVEELDRACEEVGRDPDTLSRSVDLFSLGPPVPMGMVAPAIAEQILAWEDLGFGEARLDLRVPTGMPLVDAVGAMSEVVALVHRV
jgi:alkanesulfonate monooxygenase SsuD/methylene tetrahydromethanopterin reductase-like flavin-dependent oxidoreductase (luciferase family)